MDVLLGYDYSFAITSAQQFMSNKTANVRIT